jgi:hypothetical protein
MLRIRERRRHGRKPLSCPAVLRDKAGKLLLRGRAADVSPCGIRIVAKGGASLREEQDVWVELTVPSLRASGSGHRTVKMAGQIRRTHVMGEWRIILAVVFETDFYDYFLDPTL